MPNQAVINRRNIYSKAFDPQDLGNLERWLSAETLSGLYDGASVTSWIDKTGKGNNASAGTAPAIKTGVLNGYPIVRFDNASSQYLDFGSSNALVCANYTFVSVVKTSNTTSFPKFLDNSHLSAPGGGTTISMGWDSSNPLVRVGSVFPRDNLVNITSTWHVYIFRVTNATDILIRTGTEGGVASTSSALSLYPLQGYLGRASSAYATFDIAENLVYSQALSDAAVASLIAYYKAKYNI